MRQRGRPSAQMVAQAILYLAPLLLAIILYWPSLQLPLVYDTILHVQLAADLNWLTVWQPSDGFGFYRPLVFAPMLLIRHLFDGYPAVLLHTLNVGQHALNAALVTGLTWRLWQEYRLALITGLIMASYPFTYQATIVYGNNAYVTVTGLILLGLIVYASREGARSAPNIRRTLAVVVIFAIGVLVHETAVLLIPLCLLLTLLQSPTQNLTGHDTSSSKSKFLALLRHPSTLILIGAAALYLIIYIFLPRGGGPQLDYGGNDLNPKLMILMQSAAYPLVWLGRGLFASSLQLLIGGAFIATAGGSLWAGWVRPELRPALCFGWVLWLGGSLLIAITLPTYYISDGARLLYFGGIGVALIWATLLSTLAAPAPSVRNQARAVVSTLLLILLLISGGRFIDVQISQYHLASAPIPTVTKVLERAADEDGAIVVNFPQWVSPLENSFAAGNEWSPIMGDHLFLPILFEANEGREFNVVGMIEPALLGANTRYNYGLVGAHTVETTPLEQTVSLYHVFVNRYEETAIKTEYTGRIMPEGSQTYSNIPPVATFGPYKILEAEAIMCNSVPFRLTFTLEDANNPQWATSSLFVQLISNDGRLLTQADGPPLGLPLSRLTTTPDTILVDQRLLTFTEGTPELILIGLYDYVTGERFPAVDGDQQPLPDNALVIRPLPCPAS